MYRYLWRYIRRRKKELIYIFSISIVLLIALVFIFPMKFAKFLYNGNIDGVAVVPDQKALRITKVIYLNGFGADTTQSKINEFGYTTMDSKVVLGDNVNSFITYRVSIRNYDLVSTKYNGFTFNNDNDDIIVEVSDISVGDQIGAGVTKEFSVRFKYKNGLANVTNAISNNTITFNFDNSAYSYEENDLVLDGTNYLNTGIQLFSNDNAPKDFEVSFVLESLPQNQTGQAVLFGNIDESGEPYYGVCVRYNNGITLVANVDATHKKETVINLQVGSKMVLRRVKGILSYSVDGGQHFIDYADFNGFSNYFNYPATFGAGLDNTMNPFRYYKGSLSNMSIKIIEPSYYTVRYISNGGTGTMDDQTFSVNLATNLNPLGFTREGYVFSHWNTQFNDSGNSYGDKALVKGLGQANQTVYLFAQWTENPSYTVKFDNNGGTGSMDDQSFVYGIAENLDTSTFTKDGLEFLNWNTKADGTGTTYRDGEEVKNLTDEENGVVTLYAMYGLGKYENLNTLTFNGNNNINTSQHLFDSTHIHRNFEISFDIVSVGNNANLSTLFNSMTEIDPWPGLVFRVYNANYFELNANFGDVHIMKLYDINIKKVIIRNVGDRLYFSSDGINFEDVGDISAVSESNVPIVIGSSLNNTNNPWRYFNGSIKNLVIYYY